MSSIMPTAKRGRASHRCQAVNLNPAQALVDLLGASVVLVDHEPGFGHRLEAEHPVQPRPYEVGSDPSTSSVFGGAHELEACRSGRVVDLEVDVTDYLIRF